MESWASTTMTGTKQVGRGDEAVLKYSRVCSLLSACPSLSAHLTLREDSSSGLTSEVSASTHRG